MQRLRVYIAGPISRPRGATALAHNVNQATEAFVELAKSGLIAPLCPHWSVYCKPAKVKHDGEREGDLIVWRDRVVCEATTSGNAGMSHADWLEVDLPWVDVADAVLRLPGESRGATREVKRAEWRGIPVFYSVAAVLEWAAMLTQAAS